MQLTPWRRFTARWWVCLEWKREDLWLGIFWGRRWTPLEHPVVAGIQYLNLYVCLLPTLPVHFQRTVIVRREETDA